MKIDFFLNGQHRFVDTHPSSTLLDILRKEFSLLSVHPGCRSGHCGNCSVLLDDRLTASCLIPLFHLKDSRVETLEFIMETPGFRDIELGFLKTGFFPCKFCAGVKVLTAEAILRESERPKEQLIRKFITRTWCTCTAPDPFIRAVIASAQYRQRRLHASRR